MIDAPGQGDGPDAGAPLDPPAHGEPAREVIYRPLQAWSRPHPAEGVVSVHFATREHPERRFTLTAAAARELAIQLMRHSKRVRRAVGDEREQPDDHS